MSTGVTLVSTPTGPARALVVRSTRADWKPSVVYGGTCAICHTEIPDGAKGFTLRKTNLSCCLSHWPKADSWRPERSARKTKRSNPSSKWCHRGSSKSHLRGDFWPELRFRRTGVDTYRPSRFSRSSFRPLTGASKPKSASKVQEQRYPTSALPGWSRKNESIEVIAPEREWKDRLARLTGTLSRKDERTDLPMQPTRGSHARTFILATHKSPQATAISAKVITEADAFLASLEGDSRFQNLTKSTATIHEGAGAMTSSTPGVALTYIASTDQLATNKSTTHQDTAA